MREKRKAIVVITEGAAPELLEDWCGQGLLPGFARLFAQGRNGHMRSGFVPYEPPGLATALTGQAIGDHGWFSYWTANEPDYRPRAFTSSDQRYPFIWQRPELESKRFAVINVFGTHPPVPINGWLVTYPMQQTVHACYPDGLLWKLSRKGIPYTHDVSVWYSGQPRQTFVGNVLEADSRRLQLALTLWEQAPDALILNLTSIDRVSHFYWQEMEKGSPVAIPECAIFQAYQLCDRLLTTLYELVDETTSLLAFSEIGFGPLRSYCSVNDHLETAGLLQWQSCPPQRVVKWRDTSAFEAVQGTHGININLAGRYAEGKVSPEDYASVRAEVIDTLRSSINPHTGLSLFRRVLPREEVYTGQAVNQAPDILLEPYDERYLPLGDPFWANHVNRHLQSGWHRQNSYWAGVGPAFERGSGSVECANLLDIAPTIFHMLGEASPPDFSGRHLGAAE